MTVTQHIPAFIEMGGEKPKTAEASTVADLEKSEWIAKWKEPMNFDGRSQPFRRFSMSRGDGHLSLMAEYGLGEYWWVLGYCSADLPELPSWTRPR